MKKTKLEPGDLPSALERRTLGRILGCLKPFQSDTLLVFGLITAGALLMLIPPLCIESIVDRAIPEKDVPLLLRLSGAMIAAPLVAGLLGVWQRYLATSIGEKVMLELRVGVYGRLQEQSLAYFVTARPGESVSRVLNDVQGVGSVVSSTMVNVYQNAIVLLSTMVVIIILDWRLALVAAALLPAFVSPTRRVGRQRKALKREAQSRAAELTGHLTETLSISGATLLKVFGREQAEVARFRGMAGELMRLTLAQSLVGRWFQMLLQLFEAIGPAVVFAVGGWLVIEGEIALGTVVAFVTLLRRLYPPASALAGVRVDLLTSYAYFERIFQVLDLDPEIRSPERGLRPARIEGAIAFEHVTLAYAPDAEPVLAGLDLQIEHGQCVALVGPSGAGKSTLASLVPRLWDPTSGVVRVDGHDLRTLDLATLRGAIAVVTQETFLLHATIRENLLLARPEATDAEIEAAARAARIHEMIARLPDGYLTVVGDRGHRFSGGERQRIAIARALLRDPRILILDEATSALDSENEAYVQDALETLLVGRTSIVISHRLSTLRHADRVVVLERGRIVEAGTSTELLAKNGLYARLHREQRIVA